MFLSGFQRKAREARKCATSSWTFQAIPKRRSCGDEVKEAMTNPGSWRCQECKMPAKQSHNQLAEVSQGRGHTICSQESHRQSCAFPWLLLARYHMSRMPDMEQQDYRIKWWFCWVSELLGSPLFYLSPRPSHLEWKCLLLATIYIYIYKVDNLDFVCLFLSGLQLTVFLESQITFSPSDLQLIAFLESQKDLRLGALSGNVWNF